MPFLNKVFCISVSIRLVYYGNRLIKISFSTFHITNTLAAANIACKTRHSPFTKLRKVHNEKDKFLKIIHKNAFFLLCRKLPPRKRFCNHNITKQALAARDSLVPATAATYCKTNRNDAGGKARHHAKLQADETKPQIFHAFSTQNLKFARCKETAYITKTQRITHI